MSDASQPAALVDDKKVDETKPLELPVESEPAAPAAETTEAAIEEPKKTEHVQALPQPETTAAEEPVKEAEAETKAVDNIGEPITSGSLGYKAPGLLKQLKFSKRFFWLGDEAVATQNLSHYLRGEKPEVAHVNVAWSSQTGKGLLYLTKLESEKGHPQDILNLSDATNLEKHPASEFSFKINGHKHTFKAASETERQGWYLALEKAIPEAKESKESIVQHEEYKKTISNLSKPAVLAGGVATASKAAEPMEEHSSENAIEPVEAAEIPASAGSGDEEETKKKSKSRSASRGKRSSIFGALINKREEHDAKKEHKKEEKAEATEAPAETAATETAVAEVPAAEPVEETKPAEVIEVAPVTETKAEPAKETPTPKPFKRNSIFGSIYQKVRSPTTEKKESEVAPIVPPKNEPVSSEPPKLPEPTIDTAEATPLTTDDAAEPKAEEAVAPAVAEEAPKIETKVDSPKTERKESFFESLIHRARAKSPAASPKHEAPAVPPKDEEAIAEPKTEESEAAAVAPVAETDAKKEEVAAASPKAETSKENRRKSMFGSFGKKDGEETPFNKFGSIFRKPTVHRSQSKDAKKENVAPEKTEEAVTDRPKETITEANTEATNGPKTEVNPTTEEPQQIGDVVPAAVTVGQPEQSNPAVSATA